MNFTSFFIKNPVFAVVLNVMIMVIGILSFDSILVREYPKVEIPVVSVSTTYSNASPEVVESAVTNVLEDQLAGVERIETMTSWSSPENSYISLKFLEGTAMDKALASIRDAVNMARDRLPKETKEPAIYRDEKMGGMPFIVLILNSEKLSSVELTHFANRTIKNAFRGVEGVSSVQVWGEEYVTKINVDPKKLYMFGVNSDEVYRAISSKNISRPVGKIRNITPTTLGSELKSIKDFEKIIVKHQDFSKTKNKKRSVFLKDVADIELVSDNEDSRGKIDDKNGVFIMIEAATDANPIDVSNLVQKEIKKLEKEMSSDFSIWTLIDQADYVRNSIKNTETAAFEAIFLVLLIVFVFLRNFRATLVPIVTIPISLIGAILFLKIFGFSINTMTLLAIVLAVGLVVDDAIVMLENITRHIENGMSKIDASLKGAKEIGRTIVAMTLTLVSVYTPFVFVEGVIGQIFIEFAVALAGSVLISGITALTLSPLMCSTLLQKQETRLFPQIDNFLNILIEKYRAFLDKILSRNVISLCVALGSIIVMAIFLATLPKETAPREDQGIIQGQLCYLYGKDIDFYENQASKVIMITKNAPEIKHCFSSVDKKGAWLYLPLIEKTKRRRSADDIAFDLSEKAQDFPSQEIYFWSDSSKLPGISGGRRNSSRVSIVISTAETYQELYKNLEKVKKELLKDPNFVNPWHDLDLNSLTYNIEVDNDKISKLGITEDQIAKTLEVFFSGNRTLSFQKDGIIYPVIFKSSENPYDLSGIYITNAAGKRISLDAVAKLCPSTNPSDFYHHNQMRSATLSFGTPEGVNLYKTLERAMKILDSDLPQSYRKTSTGLVASIEKSSNTMMFLFSLAFVFIFAILALQFNNFKDPLLILLTAPLGCTGALFSIWITGISLNIYTLVGLITLIGLITKHGILIVEFTNQLIAQGEPVVNAIKKAAIIRLRPILITTGAMFLGSIPLIISRSYGCEARACIGVVLTGGLFFGTIFVLLIFPTLCRIFKDKLSYP